jgi:hypothetical protein
MVEPLRHRQTKGAATDMFYLTPPRHISTLPKAEKLNESICFLLLSQQRTFIGATVTSALCHEQTFGI